MTVSNTPDPLRNYHDIPEEDRHKGVLSDVRWKFVLLCMGELVAEGGAAGMMERGVAGV